MLKKPLEENISSETNLPSNSKPNIPPKKKENIGEILKNIRLQKKLNFEEISNITKIKVEILENIENNKFKDIDEEYGYIKANTITYARFLEVDLENIIELFDELFPNEKVKIYANISSNKKTKKPLVISTNLIKFIGIILIVIVLSVLVMFLYKSGVLGKKDVHEKYKFTNKDYNIKNYVSEYIIDSKENYKTNYLIYINNNS